MESSGTLEEQLEATRAKSVEIRARKVDLKQIEDLGARLEERLILDNRYTEHSTVRSLCFPMRMFVCVQGPFGCVPATQLRVNVCVQACVCWVAAECTIIREN